MVFILLYFLNQEPQSHEVLRLVKAVRAHIKQGCPSPHLVCRQGSLANRTFWFRGFRGSIGFRVREGLGCRVSGRTLGIARGTVGITIGM